MKNKQSIQITPEQEEDILEELSRILLSNVKSSNIPDLKITIHTNFVGFSSMSGNPLSISNWQLCHLCGASFFRETGSKQIYCATHNDEISEEISVLREKKKKEKKSPRDKLENLLSQLRDEDVRDLLKRYSK